ncbi:hypothetical protein COOONC_22894, partial [Cooperia oncophora]
MCTAMVNPWSGSLCLLEATCIDELEETRIVEDAYITACDSIVETMLDGATGEKFKICQELYITERNYIDNLKLLLKVKDALLERVAKNKPVIDEGTVRQIFGKIKPLVDVHEKITAQLEDLLENFDKNQHLIAEVGE